MKIPDLISAFFCGFSIATLLIAVGHKLLSQLIRENTLNGSTLRKLEKQLPIFLDNVSSSLSSGNSLLQSLESTVDRTEPPLGAFVRRITTYTKAGMPLEMSLEKTAHETRSGTMLLVFHSMAASYRSGGNIVHSLSLLSELCRQREALHEKIQARTAQSRMQGNVLIMVPFLFLALLFITSPNALLPIIYSPLGRKILILAVILQFSGILVIRRMLKQVIM